MNQFKLIKGSLVLLISILAGSLLLTNGFSKTGNEEQRSAQEKSKMTNRTLIGYSYEEPDLENIDPFSPPTLTVASAVLRTAGGRAGLSGGGFLSQSG